MPKMSREKLRSYSKEFKAQIVKECFEAQFFKHHLELFNFPCIYCLGEGPFFYTAFRGNVILDEVILLKNLTGHYHNQIGIKYPSISFSTLDLNSANNIVQNNVFLTKINLIF